jgi:hypothetical protein
VPAARARPPGTDSVDCGFVTVVVPEVCVKTPDVSE